MIDNSPAFSRIREGFGNPAYDEAGMTLRDWLARKATLADVARLLAGWSDSEFATAASGEYCEDLKSMIEGAIGRSLDEATTQAAEIARLKSALCHVVHAEASDVEIEDALTSEGVTVWGPDGERFDRMFSVVMKGRQKVADAALEAQAALLKSQEAVSDAVHKALWDADAEIARLREALQCGVKAVDTGRNEPLMIWRDQARNLTGSQSHD